MDEENKPIDNNVSELKTSDVSSKKDGSNTFIVLFLAASCVAIFFMVMYFIASDNVSDCIKESEAKDLNFSNTVNNVTILVAQQVTSDIVDQIILKTNNCSVITVTKDNVTRNLADLSCMQETINQMLGNTTMSANVTMAETRI